MNVRVLYFAILREERGRAEEVVTLKSGMTISALFERIFKRTANGVRFARNQSYVPESQIVEDGDEIAFLPPLGGG